MPSIQPTQHACVSDFVNLPKNTRIGMTEKEQFVSYGGTSFYFHPEQTLRVSRFMKPTSKVEADGTLHRISRWQRFLNDVRAVFQGVKASSFIKRYSRGHSAVVPSEPPAAPPSEARIRFEQSITAVLAAERFSEAGARTPTQPAAIRRSTSRAPAPPGSPDLSPTLLAKIHLRPPKTHQPVASPVEARTWSAPPQLTPPAIRSGTL
ncbi:hypothetical protein PIN31009_00288 [Pandoraea iniqua]|uniref:hypothetical protein n=1 Tax=Pandoraea iniqua TaxID=2508288 RepID=UPI00123EF319|nr:hypothetical protein [Pandoraea iniqua]VVD64683.1 hypothetical protein PIN31009_00288 [Pandoraea iniqua]